MATGYQEIDISTWIKGTKAQICTSENISAENLEKGDVLLNAGTNESWNIKIIK